jgi:hypothetical protein
VSQPPDVTVGGVPVAEDAYARMFPEVFCAGQLTALGLNGTGTAPAIAGVTHATASAPLGHDMGGSFTLTTDGTGVTGPATIATITFGTPLAAAPAAVLISVDDSTDGTHIATCYATATATVITVKDSATLAASKVYNVTYIVVAS